MTPTPRTSVDTILSLIERSDEVRYQDPQLEREGQIWFIRAYVPVVKDGTVKRIRRRFVIGVCTKREAVQRREAILADVNCERLILQSQVTFGALLDKFEAAHMPTLGAATQNKYHSLIGNHIRPAFGGLRAVDITLPVVQEWLVSRPGSWALREALKNLLSSIFARAKEWKLWDAPALPTEGARHGKKKAVRVKRLLRPEQLNQILAEIQDARFCTAQAGRLMVMIACLTGMRVSEVLGLQWSDFDAEGFVRVNRRFHRGDTDSPKTEASEGRRHYIAPLAEELRLYRRRTKGGDADRLFEGFDDRDFQQHVLRPAAERAKAYTPGFGMHSLRRLYITWRQQVGGTPFEAMKAAGHTKPDMTLLYTLADETREREQVEQMFGRVDRRLM